MGETKKVKTICGYCGTGCGLILEVENNKIVKSRGDKDAPVNQGQTCIKGSFGFGYVHAESRLTTPLIRHAGELIETTWEHAYNYIAEKLQQIKNTFGPEAITAFAPARASNEVNYITQKFMRTAIGSNNIDGCNRT